MIAEITGSLEEVLAYVETVPSRQGRSMAGVPLECRDVVRVGLIGLGERGSYLLGAMLAVDGIEVTAISDPKEDCVRSVQHTLTESGHPEASVVSDWRRLCERQDVDIVYICTPWELHTTIAVFAMEQGKHAAVEVPAATTIADCWRLVDTSERTRRHCIMLENCCYGQYEMMVCNMVHHGLLGTITHAEAAYIHDLRSHLFADNGEALWRRVPHTLRNGNLYPTHGLGPVAKYMDINHGDSFCRLVSMSSLAAGMGEYGERILTADDHRIGEIYKCGDMNSSLIQTAMGRTVLLQYDLVTPRPYSRINLVQGTKGAFCDFPPRIFLDGQEDHDWSPIDELVDEYDSLLWKEQGEAARNTGGHGGMDYIMNYRLVELFRNGLPPDIDVYDAATWSVPGPLSVISVAFGNIPVPFPDFTRGDWMRSVIPNDTALADSFQGNALRRC